MTLAEILQYGNLLLAPAVVYIVKLEARLARLETHIEALLKSIP